MKSFTLVFALGLLAATNARAEAEPPRADKPAESTETIVASRESASASSRDSRCLRHTGTRLAKRDRNGCTGSPGQSYSREDLERSGGIGTGDALRSLNPGFTVSRGG